MPIHLLKKGQIKMFESIAMLIIFFFLVAIGLRFYGGFEVDRLEQLKERFGDFDSIKLSVTVAHLPELKCSLQGVEEGACVDVYKVESFATVLNSGNAEYQIVKDYYESIFGPAEVVLEQLQPEPERMVVYNSSLSSPDFRYTPLPVSIWDPVSRSYGLGILHVKVFTIQ